MLNINSTLRASMENLEKYKKQAIEAERILDGQFNPAIIPDLEASARRCHSTGKKPARGKHSVLKKIRIRTEEDPKKIMAWAIAQRVREARETHGLRQEDLARMSGIARPNIVRIEQGRHVPTFATLKKIADALRLDMNRLTAEPKVTPEDRDEFAGMAESGIEDWGKALEEEDGKN